MWGLKKHGGDPPSSVRQKLTRGVQLIASTKGAFAAVKGDGSVVTWGHKDYGGDSDSVQQQLKSGVQHIYATNSAFAALKADGSVVAWGNPREGWIIEAYAPARGRASTVAAEPDRAACSTWHGKSG